MIWRSLAACLFFLSNSVSRAFRSLGPGSLVGERAKKIRRAKRAGWKNGRRFFSSTSPTKKPVPRLGTAGREFKMGEEGPGWLECSKPLLFIPPVVLSRPSSPRWTLTKKTVIKTILEKSRSRKRGKRIVGIVVRCFIHSRVPASS